MQGSAEVNTGVQPLVNARLLPPGVLRLTLSNPARRNALSLAMMGELSRRLEDAAADRTVRVIVLSHEGPVFSAGHDLKEMTEARSQPDRGRGFFEKTMKRCSDLMQSIVLHPKPVIAEVGGVATAAGCQLVASCDLAVAGQSAKFATPGVQIGLFCSTPMVALSRNVARKHAMEMLLTGEMVGAQRAMEIGLVNRVVADEALEAETLALAGVIAGKSQLTLRTGKRAFYEQAEMPLRQAYDHAAKVMVENMMARDAEEGINAFIEKRQPEWRDE